MSDSTHITRSDMTMTLFCPRAPPPYRNKPICALGPPKAKYIEYNDDDNDTDQMQIN